jgi:acyl-CoA synthetase (NDP forming)
MSKENDPLKINKAEIRPADRAAQNVQKVAALLNPRNVVILGATDKPGNWSPLVHRLLKQHGFKGKIYPLNPGRDEVWGEKCYRSFADLPEPPDQLVALVPAKAVPALLRDGAAAGARSATVMTSGFDEGGHRSGRALAAELRQVIADSGLAVSGPNCMGNAAAPNTFFSLADERPQQFARGPVAVIGQSGGLAMAIKRTLEERGVATGHLITTGNEAGLTAGDYIRYFVREPDTKVIVLYLEGVRDRDTFLAACREAKAAGKPVVVAKLGASTEGQAAALAHTGALAGSMAAFDAIASAAGAIRVDTLDDAVEVVELLLHAKLPAGGNLGALTISGGLRGLLLDAAAHHGLKFPPLAEDTRAKLSELLGAGSIVGNPLDSGYAAIASHQTYLRCLDLLISDPGVDALLVQGEIPRVNSPAREKALREIDALAAKAGKPIAYVSMISYGLTDAARALRSELTHLPFLQEPRKALRAVKSVADYVANLAPAASATVTVSKAAQSAGERIRALAAKASKPLTLSEPESKALLAAYGIAVSKETVVNSAAAAIAAANEIGLPVVLKAVSADLPHKTEAGAVLIGLDTEDAVRRGYDTILANVAKHAPGVTLDGVLVAEMVKGGMELALGVSNDPEVGPVVMFGQGGIALELYKDVAFADPALDAGKAGALIERTKAAQLMNGFRGQSGFDRKAVEAALVALGQLTRDLGDVIEAIDINPFVARRGKGGAVALDALVIVRALDSHS